MKWFLLILLVLSLMIFVSPYTPFESFESFQSHPPSPPNASHWLGIDDRGRDVLIRLVYSIRSAVLFGLLTCSGILLVGMAIGIFQGYVGGFLDLLTQHFERTWSLIPISYIAIIIAGWSGASFGMLCAIWILFGWMRVSQIARAEAFRTKEKDFVGAVHALGGSNLRIVFYHLLPSVWESVCPLIPFLFCQSVVGLTALDFLGLGLPAPVPSLGELLRQARENPSAWWLSIPTLSSLVGLMLYVRAISNLIGRASISSASAEARVPRSIFTESVSSSI